MKRQLSSLTVFTFESLFVTLFDMNLEAGCLGLAEMRDLHSWLKSFPFPD